MRALEGLRVLEWGAFHHGVGAGYMLGDLGADVIKIEDPERGDASRGITDMWGDSVSLPGGRLVMFEVSNRNKRGITLNLREEQGREILYRLVEKSDVFITNYRRETVKKVHADYESLRQYNPRLIYAVGSPAGRVGEYADKRAFDTVAQALSGAMYLWGDRDDEEPALGSAAPMDQLGATMTAYGILAALVARDRHGIGQEIDVSLLGATLHLYAINIASMGLMGKSRSRWSRKRARNPMGNHYRCSDGKWIMLAEMQSDRFWHEFCDAMGIGELEKVPRFANAVIRRKNYREMIETLDKLFATKTRDEWITRFKKKKVGFAYCPVYTPMETMEAPELRLAENQFVVPFDHPVLGNVRVPGFPVSLSETPAAIQREAPSFGQHTEDVLIEVLGYSWDDIGRLKDAMII